MTSKPSSSSSLYNSLCFKFSHAALDTANGVIYVAGQVAFDKDHNIVGGEDFGTQARQVPANWRTVLDETNTALV
jgi:enamine deaminase RidA (YjgF/YER057c/UK114 family)